ncbi:MAG: transcription termination factor Rho [Terrimicrobiaceae bacterium]|nr:transcription termination factor Rho [Terrimicrobiaceae bacterium]
MTEDTQTQLSDTRPAVNESTEPPQRPRRGRPPRRREPEANAGSPLANGAAPASAADFERPSPNGTLAATAEDPALVSPEVTPTQELVAVEDIVVAQTTPPETSAAPAIEDSSPQATAPAPEISRPAPQPPPPAVYAEGIVEVSGKGFGFLREPKRNFTQSNNDVFVTPEVIRKHNLRDGMWIKGETRRGPRGPQLFKLTELEHENPANFDTFPVFEELTTVSPDRRIKLETTSDLYTTRVIDLIAPIGRGQRGLIVAPPRTGKTTLLQHIAGAVVKNYPDIKLIILLVDERPEEVTEIRRTVPQAEIMASSNDSDVKTHTRISQLAIERAKRLVEMGKDVFVLMDSLTRMGRAFNNAQGGGGRTMSGGVDSRALEIPRKLFAAARNTEEAGSLTIVATALIETNSRMDDLIFQEFKGTGNMELVLGRLIAEQRIYPAVDIFQSGTRREELLLAPEDLHKINVIRRGLAGHKPIEAIERLLFFIRKYPTNAEMLKGIPG